MGRTHQKKGAHCKVKKYKKSRDTKRRKRDVDQIFDDVEKIEVKEAEGRPAVAPDFDEDLPGGGQFYCVETGRHFTDQQALDAHRKSRFFRRRLKELKEDTKYTLTEAEWAGGMTTEQLPKLSAARMQD